MSSITILNQTEVNVLIDKIGSVASVLQTDIHQAGCSVFSHSFVHGDNTGVTRLLDKLPNGQRVKALAHWFNHFSNGALTLSVNPTTKGWQVNKERFARRADLIPNLQVALDKAMALNFADLKPEVGHDTLTLKQFLKSLKRSATNVAYFDGTKTLKVSKEVNIVASQMCKLIESYMAEQAAAQLSVDVVNVIKDAQVGIPGVTTTLAAA
jgi:hypothetical protein